MNDPTPITAKRVVEDAQTEFVLWYLRTVDNMAPDADVDTLSKCFYAGFNQGLTASKNMVTAIVHGTHA